MLNNSVELINNTPEAYAFDVDGVLTNPHTKRIEIVGILEQIAAKLNNLVPVGLITGRGLSFIEEIVIRPLLPHLNDVTDLKLLFAIGEKSGSLLTYNARLEEERSVSKLFQVPLSFQNKVRELVKRKFPESMFYDEEKRCMVSVEYLSPSDGGTVSFEQFQTEQRSLVARLNNMSAMHELENHFEVDATTIATDFQSKLLGKDSAMRTFIRLMRARGIFPNEITCFGDSLSDYAMRLELLEQKIPHTFVYVGEIADLDDLSAKGVIFTRESYGKFFDKGTYQYLTDNRR